MSSAGDSAGESDHALLCWPDAASDVSRELFVEIVEMRFPETLLKSACELPVNTKVRLVGQHYTGDGTVLSCRKEDQIYILGISLDEKLRSCIEQSGFDPGLLAIEDFLTEEQEAKILQDLNEEDGWGAVNFMAILRSGRLPEGFGGLVLGLFQFASI